eukprot:3570355-Rhodomonas_salina.1
MLAGAVSADTRDSGGTGRSARLRSMSVGTSSPCQSDTHTRRLAQAFIHEPDPGPNATARPLMQHWVSVEGSGGAKRMHAARSHELT